MWFILAILGYSALAVVFVLDKLILSKSIDKPVVYTFYSTIFMLLLFLVVPFGVERLVGIDWIIALVSGLGFGFGLWTMYIAVVQSDASKIDPFIGASITVITFIIAYTFLGETLTSLQITGMVILVLATLMLSLVNKRGVLAIERGFAWGLASGVFFAVSHVAAKYIYELYPFFTGFVWTRAASGFVGVGMLLSPAVIATFRRKKSVAVEQCTEKGFAKKHAVGIILTNKVLGVVGSVLVQLAVAIGSVTLVSALVGIQYAIMFVLLVLLTKFAPKILSEKYNRRGFIIEVVSLVLVVLGAGLFVF